MNIKANYILLDSAKMDSDMVIARGLNPEHTCLYEGDNEKYYGVVAPWLFDFREGTEFAKWIADNAQGNDWGIFLRSEAEPHEVYQHLRKFIVVRTEDGNELFFRFYDPRVLRVFLPTCDRNQLKEFFGPIDAFIAEDENGLLVEYGYQEQKLNHQNLGKEIASFFDEGYLEETVESDETDSKELEPEQVEEEKSEGKDSSGQSEKGWDFGY